MASFGMKTRDVDCIIEMIAPNYPIRTTRRAATAEDKAARAGGEFLQVTGAAINDAARQCGIDTSKLRRSGD
jgi:hypothetical protein